MNHSIRNVVFTYESVAKAWIGYCQGCEATVAGMRSVVDAVVRLEEKHLSMFGEGYARGGR